MEALISIAGSILGSLASKTAEYTVDPIARQLSYLFKHKSKFQNLMSKVEELKAARERVERSILDANRNGEEIFPDVNGWLTVVDGKISDQAATQLQEDEEKAKKKCFAGFCSDFKSRYQLSKKAETEANTIAELLNQKVGFDRVSFLPAPKGRYLRPVKEYEAFESRSGALNEVVEALKDDNCSIIGVHGMGGVGKTTLVKEVARQAKEKQLFEEVVFVAVTQTPNPENIQNEIAEKLGQKFVEASVDVRADRLSDRVKKGKVLIILDDIWVKLDLDALGIPSRDEHKGCKILMTSRKLDVLQLMDSQKNVPIDMLKEDEAWNLFKNITGDIVERSDLQSTAIEVSRKCAGLPIAIATVAKALKNKKNSFEWENALEELRRPRRGAVYSAIELSYKFLEDEDLQFTFLLCSTMGHDAAIEDLLDYCRGFGLFSGLNTIEKVRNKVLTSVSDLKNSSLLLAGSSPMRFDMHDVVCDVARSIASSDRHWLVLGSYDGIQEWSDKENLKNYNLISLQQCAGVSELLSHELVCPNLNFFSLSSEESSLKIPNNFFLEMDSLKVLDFKKIDFSSLPSSMGSLKNIRTLCFSACILKDIGIIGELRNLEILNLRESDIAMLPSQIRQLTRLKLLDLSDCRHLKVISPNVLSSLSRLEELRLYGSFDRWVVEGIDDPRSNASLVELQHLSHLTTLELHIPNEQAMPKDFLFSGKMERYKISIGMKWADFHDNGMETSRRLKLRTNKSIHLYDGVKTLFRNTKSLCVIGVQSNDTWLFDQKVVFLSLEKLTLGSINNIEKLWHDQVSVTSFSVQNLTSLSVVRCHKLKYVFTSSMVKSFVQLERLYVSACEEMKEVIAGILGGGEDSISGSIIVFPKLHLVELEDLPNLRRFCFGINPIEFSFLKELKIIRCRALCTFYDDSAGVGKSSSIISMENTEIPHHLFNEKIMFPALEELALVSVSSIEKIWHDQILVTSFGVQNLTSLSVWRCHKLKCVFPSSMVKSFVQLETLNVGDCEEMEEVIVGILGGGKEERISARIIAFPKLDDVKLDTLPNLKRICSGIATIEFPLLQYLQIWNCPVLSTFHCDSTSVGKSNNSISTSHNFDIDIPASRCLFNQKIEFPALEELKLLFVSSIEKIWYDHIPVTSFAVQNLTSLRVWCCHKLESVFPSSMIKSFVQLKTLNVGDCEEMEEVIAGILRGEEERISTRIIVFPKLDYVALDTLPNLKRICSGITPIEFPFLQYLHIWHCPVLSIFHCDSTSVGKSSSCISTSHNFDIDIPTSSYLFNQKVSLPMLQHLSLAALNNLERLWSNQLAQDSFSKLISIYLGSCKLIEEIMEGRDDDNDDEVKHEITFPLLKTLELFLLPKLESFCSSGNYTFVFPVLEDVSVRDCPKMKMFSQGDSNTPLLHKVRLDLFNKEAGSWAGSLNSTIQQLFTERICSVAPSRFYPI